MVGKRIENIKEIKAYRKVCTEVGHSVKQIFTELGEVYGSHKVSYETVCRWRKKFHTGKIRMTGYCKGQDECQKLGK